MALAPSLRADELPAVIWVVLGCGGRPANCSSVVSPRMPSSCSNVCAGSFFVPGISTGWISRASRPESRCRSRSMVRTQREGVNLLASQVVSVRHVLSRLDHLDVGIPSQQYWVGWSPGAGPHRVEEKDGAGVG